MPEITSSVLCGIVDVINEDERLIPGMTANVSIITSKKENIMTVPNAALKFTPNTDGSGQKYKEQGIWIMDNKICLFSY